LSIALATSTEDAFENVAGIAWRLGCPLGAEASSLVRLGANIGCDLELRAFALLFRSVHVIGGLLILTVRFGRGGILGLLGRLLSLIQMSKPQKGSTP